MSFDYSRPRATAERLIKRFGQDAILDITTNSGDPWKPTQSEATQIIKVVVLDYEDSDIDGTIIQRNDKRLYISTEGATIEPSTEHEVTVVALNMKLLT